MDAREFDAPLKHLEMQTGSPPYPETLSKESARLVLWENLTANVFLMVLGALFKIPAFLIPSNVPLRPSTMLSGLLPMEDLLPREHVFLAILAILSAPASLEGLGILWLLIIAQVILPFNNENWIINANKINH